MKNVITRIYMCNEQEFHKLQDPFCFKTINMKTSSILKLDGHIWWAERKFE
jgi:hypothetical protein